MSAKTEEAGIKANERVPEKTSERVAEKSLEKAPERVGEKRTALGRGLASLLPGGVQAGVLPGAAGKNAAGENASREGASGRHGSEDGGGEPIEIQAVAARREGHSIVDLPVDAIEHNPYQTRTRMSEEELAELAESIRANGIIQPITVRPGKDGKYVLITGERRTRASKLAGKATVPAIVRHVSEQQAAEMTIIENLQRQDLNPLEQAEAFARLSRQFALTQEQIGKRVGLSRESVSNYMRILKLPEATLMDVRAGRLGFSEARLLLTLEDPELINKIAYQTIRDHLSVESLETLIMREQGWLDKKPGPPPPTRGARWVDPNVKAAQRELERTLGMRVRIRDRKGKGKIVIEYTKLEDFDRVLQMLKGK